jgi:hypothetical protein
MKTKIAPIHPCREIAGKPCTVLPEAKSERILYRVKVLVDGETTPRRVSYSSIERARP